MNLSDAMQRQAVSNMVATILLTKHELAVQQLVNDHPDELRVGEAQRSYAQQRSDLDLALVRLREAYGDELIDDILSLA